MNSNFIKFLVVFAVLVTLVNCIASLVDTIITGSHEEADQIACQKAGGKWTTIGYLHNVGYDKVYGCKK